MCHRLHCQLCNALYVYFGSNAFTCSSPLALLALPDGSGLDLISLPHLQGFQIVKH